MHGILLAAGAGRRMGGPKALRRDPDDPEGSAWMSRSVAVLLEGGCAEVTVVLGAAGAEAAALVPVDPRVRSVPAPDWTEGMGASLRTGLEALARDEGRATAALVHLVDLPDVTAPVIARVLAAADGSASLARATYAGRPGHPVLLGRDHWPAILATAHGDRGARDYLRAHPPVPVECGDLATGRDVDRPP